MQAQSLIAPRPRALLRPTTRQCLISRGTGMQGSALSRGSAKTFTPASLPGLQLWLQSNLGVTVATGPTVAAGTTPPAATITGAPSASTASGASAGTAMVEIDIEVPGILGTAQFQWLLNGVFQASGLVTAAHVALGTTGLTANFPAGTYATAPSRNIYTAYATVGAWADQSGHGRSASNGTSSQQPLYSNQDSHYNSQPSLTFVAANTSYLGVALTQLQPMTIYIVGNETTGSVAGFDDGAGITVFSGSFERFAMYAGATLINPGGSVASASCLAAVFNGASSAGYQNSSAAAVFSGNPGAAHFTGSYFVGGAGVTANPMSGAQTLQLVYSVAHTPAQISTVFRYAASLYGGAWS